MTPFPYSIEAEANLLEAEKMMAVHAIRHLPVKKHGALVGVVTDRDLKRAADPSLGLPGKTDLAVRDVMWGEAYVVDLNERLDKVLLHLAEAHVSSALVVRQGLLAGIFTTTDACRVLGEFLRSQGPGGGAAA